MSETQRPGMSSLQGCLFNGELEEQEEGGDTLLPVDSESQEGKEVEECEAKRHALKSFVSWAAS